MPLNKSGKKVLASMKKTYGKDAKNVFYATMEKRGMGKKWETKKKKK